ncbi:MAG TPA: hypothetical protein VJ777_16100 [Mycobacterium sp.]|nr:hypothetical protein [Mycobacterium sp.]
MSPATTPAVPVADADLLTNPAEVVVVVTDRSVWVITVNAYLRMRRDKFRKRLVDETYSLWGRLEDDVWHPHRGAFWREARDGFIVNIRPEAGPADGYGITTGRVEAASMFDLELVINA